MKELRVRSLIWTKIVRASETSVTLSVTPPVMAGMAFTQLGVAGLGLIVGVRTVIVGCPMSKMKLIWEEVPWWPRASVARVWIVYFAASFHDGTLIVVN